MLQSEIKGLHHLVFVDQGHHNLLVLLQPLQHVEAQLESWFVVGLLGDSPRAKSDEDTGQFKRVVQNVELEELVEHGVLLCLEDELDKHGLLGGLQWDLVLEHTSQELEQNRGHVPHLEPCCGWLCAAFLFCTRSLSCPLGVQGRLRCVDDVTEDVVSFVLENYGLTREDTICLSNFSQECIQSCSSEGCVSA